MLPPSLDIFSTPMKTNIVKKGPGLAQEPPLLAENEIRISASTHQNGDHAGTAEILCKSRRKNLVASVVLLASVSFAGFAVAGIEEAKKWVENEFQPSTLSKEEQMKEMEWFVKAAAPFKGMEIKVLSETVPTHT